MDGRICKNLGCSHCFGRVPVQILTILLICLILSSSNDCQFRLSHPCHLIDQGTLTDTNSSTWKKKAFDDLGWIKRRKLTWYLRISSNYSNATVVVGDLHCMMASSMLCPARLYSQDYAAYMKWPINQIHLNWLRAVRDKYVLNLVSVYNLSSTIHWQADVWWRY